MLYFDPLVEDTDHYLEGFPPILGKRGASVSNVVYQLIAKLSIKLWVNLHWLEEIMFGLL